MDYPKHTYIYLNGISDVSKQPDEPEPEVPSIPFDVQLASDLYANVGLHTGLSILNCKCLERLKH